MIFMIIILTICFEMMKIEAEIVVYWLAETSNLRTDYFEPFNGKGEEFYHLKIGLETCIQFRHLHIAIY